MRRSRGWLFGAMGAAAALALVAACGGDDGGRTGFENEAGTPPLPESSDAAPVEADIVDARGPFDPSDEAVACESSPCVTQLVAGGHHFCARTSDGFVRCWGDDEKGQLGLASEDAGADAGAGKPAVSGLSSVTQISAAGTTTCARVSAGAVHCWGGNGYGELGRAIDPPFDEAAHPLAERVALEDVVDRVDVGNGSVCASAIGGTVVCWGNDGSGQLARGAPSGPGGPPARAELGVSVKRTAAGIDTAFALAEDGTLLSWGAVSGPTGILGGRTSSVTLTPSPAPVDALGSVSSFSVSGPMPGLPPPGWFPGMPPPPDNQHACAVSNGEVYCWGRSDRGALGNRLPDLVVPLPMYARTATRAYAQQVSAGGKNTCVRLTDGAVLCTGENERGQLGTGARGPFSSGLVKVATLTGRAVHVAVANETVCALLQGGAVECWGGNALRELGLGARDDEAHPSATKVPF